MNDGVMENYGNIVGNLERIVILEKKIKMLDERILKLETIIVKVCNEEEEAFDERMDWADQAQMVRDNEDDEE